ncbi:hypothetical protein LBYZC6_50250 [Lacrimispora brassicae]
MHIYLWANIVSILKKESNKKEKIRQKGNKKETIRQIGVTCVALQQEQFSFFY